MATSRKALSRNGTLASTPHAIVDLNSLVSYRMRRGGKSQTTCWRANNQRYGGFSPGLHILGGTTLGLVPRGSIDSLQSVRRQNQIIKKELTPKNLVTAFSAKYHLNPHCLDFSAEEVHGRAGTNGCNVVGLKVINNLWERVQTILNGEHIFVMRCFEILGRFSRC
jgi:hypothetical protein